MLLAEGPRIRQCGPVGLWRPLKEPGLSSPQPLCSKARPAPAGGWGGAGGRRPAIHVGVLAARWVSRPRAGWGWLGPSLRRHPQSGSTSGRHPGPGAVDVSFRKSTQAFYAQ